VSAGQLTEWDAAIRFCPRLLTAPAVTSAQDAFRTALRSVAEANVAENRRYVEARIKALGMDGGEPLTEQQQADLRHSIQNMAYHAYELRQEQARLRTLVVGYEAQNLGFGEHESHFDPGRPPKHRGTLFSTPPGDWDQAKETWDDAEGQLAAIGNDYPELYAGGAGEEGTAALLNLSRVVPEHFGEEVKQQLLKLGDRIHEVQDMITSGRLDLLDLGLLTQAVLTGQPAAGGRDWSKGFDQWAAKRLLADREADKAAVRAVFQTVEITALVVGTFAGGIGPLLAAGATAGLEAFQAGQAAMEANRLEKAATATPVTGTALVSKAQADSKRSEAIAHMVQAVVSALFAAGTAVSGGLRVLRLRGLVQDEALLARLRGLAKDDVLLETLLRKAGDPAVLEQLLGKFPAAQLGPLVERIGTAKLTGSLLQRCPNAEQLARLLDRVNPEQLDQLLTGVAESDLPRLEQVLGTLGDGKPGSVAFNIGGELDAKAGEVVINPGRQAMSIERLRTMKPDNIVVSARAESIPFPDGSGRSLVGDKLPNSIDWATAAKEFKRVLAPGSKVNITVYGSGAPLRKALTEQGFAVTPPLRLPDGSVLDNSVVAVRP